MLIWIGQSASCGNLIGLSWVTSKGLMGFIQMCFDVNSLLITMSQCTTFTIVSIIEMYLFKISETLTLDDRPCTMYSNRLHQLYTNIIICITYNYPITLYP